MGHETPTARTGVRPAASTGAAADVEEVCPVPHVEALEHRVVERAGRRLLELRPVARPPAPDPGLRLGCAASVLALHAARLRLDLDLDHPVLDADGVRVD